MPDVLPIAGRGRSQKKRQPGAQWRGQLALRRAKMPQRALAITIVVADNPTSSCVNGLEEEEIPSGWEREGVSKRGRKKTSAGGRRRYAEEERATRPPSSSSLHECSPVALKERSSSSSSSLLVASYLFPRSRAHVSDCLYLDYLSWIARRNLDRRGAGECVVGGGWCAWIFAGGLMRWIAVIWLLWWRRRSTNSRWKSGSRNWPRCLSSALCSSPSWGFSTAAPSSIILRGESSFFFAWSVVFLEFFFSQYQEK